MVRLLYIFFSLFVLSCSQVEPSEDIESLNIQGLQDYNLIFRTSNLEYYFQAVRTKTTIKAEGGGSISLDYFDMLKSLVDEVDALIKMHLTNFSIEERSENTVKKAEIEADIMRALADLKSFADRDIIHQDFKNNERLDYQRNYSEEEFEDDISRYIERLQHEFNQEKDELSKEDAIEIMTNSQSLLYLAERKVLLFLLESLSYRSNLNPVITSEVRADYEGVVHHAGEKIKLDLQQLVLFESNLLSYQYRVFYEDREEIYDIKGSISPRIDTIWLPTDKIGNYRIEGESKQNGSVERTRSWVYEYKVISQ